jgi:lysozyme
VSLHGIDISCYQGKVDFDKARSSGKVDFVYAKASEGLEYVDECFRRYHDGAKASEIPFGAYHFYHFGHDPLAQAEHFLKTIDGYGGHLLPMVDVEDGSLCHGFTQVQGIKDLGVFAAHIKGVVGKNPVLYTGWSFWQDHMKGSTALGHCPLWVAEYNSLATPALPAGFSSWALWQYSSEGRIPGINGDVDCDQLNGTDLKIITR